MCLLYCLGYIRAYCYNFIQLIDKCSTKLKDYKKIIDAINQEEEIKKIIILYIYKIIYNKNKKNIYIFLNSEFIQKYKLNEYNDFNRFIINQEENPFIYQYINSNNGIKYNYENFYKTSENYKQKNFEDIDIDEFNIEKIGIDIFYFSTSNLILSCLKLETFENSVIYTNFFKNVCKPLFKSHNKIFTAIQLFYNPEKFKKIKKEYLTDSENENNSNVIDSEFLNILLFSYRYCLNELNSVKTNSIYNFFYNKKNIYNINKFYYPGNDIRNIPIYEIYFKIKNHFKNNLKRSCFVCLCEKGQYLNVDEKKPKNYEGIKCKGCQKPM